MQHVTCCQHVSVVRVIQWLVAHLEPPSVSFASDVSFYKEVCAHTYTCTHVEYLLMFLLWNATELSTMNAASSRASKHRKVWAWTCIDGWQQMSSFCIAHLRETCPPVHRGNYALLHPSHLISYARCVHRCNKLSDRGGSKKTNSF